MADRDIGWRRAGRASYPHALTRQRPAVRAILGAESMSLFRKRVSLDEAVRRLGAVVTGFDEFDKGLAEQFGADIAPSAIRDQLRNVRLFGVYVACQIARDGMWRDQIPRLMKGVFELTLETSPPDDTLPREFHLTELERAIKYYELAAVAAQGSGSIDRLADEVGTSFCMALTKHPPETMPRVAKGVFHRALAQTDAIQKKIKLQES